MCILTSFLSIKATQITSIGELYIEWIKVLIILEVFIFLFYSFLMLQDKQSLAQFDAHFCLDLLNFVIFM